MRVIHINAETRTITEVELTPEQRRDPRGHLRALQALVGGLISTAYRFENGDELFVDDEGLLKDPRHFFRVVGCAQPFFAGNGVVVGGATKAGYDTAAKSTVASLSRCVGFATVTTAAEENVKRKG